jgi:hypothetical protein
MSSHTPYFVRCLLRALLVLFLSGSLSLFEIQGYIKGLQEYPLSEVGSDRWNTQHEHLEALNLQAHADAQASKHDEQVVEQFSEQEKVGTLIHELLVIEAWKEKVFPLLLDHFSPITAVKAYMTVRMKQSTSNIFGLIYSNCKLLGCFSPMHSV